MPDLVSYRTLLTKPVIFFFYLSRGCSLKMSYYSLLVPLVATVALLIICFILYIFYGEKCCKSQHKGSATKTFAYGIETLDVPAEEINFTCKYCFYFGALDW